MHQCWDSTSLCAVMFMSILIQNLLLLTYRYINLVITFRQLRWYIIKNFQVSRKEYEKLEMSR